MTARVAGLALAGLALLACGGGTSVETSGGPLGQPVEYPPATGPVPLETYVREGALAAGLDRAQTVGRLGAPERIEAQPVTNRHDPRITDSIVTLHYPDARYVFYVVTQADRDLLDLAVIRSNRHLRYAPPGIGTPVDSVRALLGEPVAARFDLLEYDCLTCEVPLPVTFELRDGRVHRILFDYYVD
ncbi:MAG TPA: hypothetical protein VMN78_08705 [Longimicrobiales bacterium]|nr:hypothetical protein [Longimicrobiales bacterium]